MAWLSKRMATCRQKRAYKNATNLLLDNIQVVVLSEFSKKILVFEWKTERTLEGNRIENNYNVLHQLYF